MLPESQTETPVQTVERLSALARIQIPEDKKEALAVEFRSVLAYIAQLDGLTLSASDTPPLPPLHNAFRKDEDPYTPGTWTEEIVRAFPAKKDNLLTVKKILSHD